MCIRVPLPTYTGSFFIASDAELRKETLQECQRSGENCLLIMVAVQQEIVYLRPNRGAGVFQIVSQKIVGGYVQGVGDGYQRFETRSSTSRFDIADIDGSCMNSVSQLLL